MEKEYWQGAEAVLQEVNRSSGPASQTLWYIRLSAE